MYAGDDQKVQVQQASDVVALVSEHIRLQPRGKDFVGLCPFHDDKKPSMYVSPSKQIYKCFSCGAGGDVFSWMTNYHKMTFPEALKFLAERAGIELRRAKRDPQTASEEPSERQLIARANADALGFFRVLLRHETHGKIARDYLESRNISPAMIEAFQIGYAPDRWDGLVTTIQEKRWNPNPFALAGLITARNKEQDNQPSAPQTPDPRPQTPTQFYDRLRHRLIFPICDALGRPIAFGGRALAGGTIGDPSDAKYLNSPETVLFNKSATLYGLHLAKKPIIDSRVAVIVEGYTDVVACHQAGFTNVLATLGTAFTAPHAAMLKRFADRVVLIFDADEAGQKAADRAVEVLFTGDVDVAVSILPAGSDPADLLSQPEGAAAWRALLDGAIDALDYQFERVRGQFEGEATLAGRQRVAEDYLRRLAHMGLSQHGGMIRRAMIVQKLAIMLHLTDSQVAGMIKRFTPAKSAPKPQNQSPDSSHPTPDTRHPTPDSAHPDPPTVIGPETQKNIDTAIVLDESGAKITALQQAERQIIGCVLVDPGLFHQPLADGREFYEAITPVDLLSDSAKQLYQLIYEILIEGRDLTLTSVLAELSSRGEQGLCDLATLAEAQVEQETLRHEDRLKELIQSATWSLCRASADRDYQATRAAASADGQPNDEEQLRRVFEHQRANPTGARIARLEASV